MAAAQGQRPQPGAITVPAKPEWTDTGIDLLPGDSCTISAATGQWSNAAAPAPFSSYRGFANDRTPGLKVANRLGALIGKVGSDPPVYAGADVTIKATAHGHLLLGMMPRRRHNVFANSSLVLPAVTIHVAEAMTSASGQRESFFDHCVPRIRI